ncbi:MAG: polysaccharide biosynthesis protein [Lentisphaeria bacterium]|jgi:UDP-N-acetylglucosamine 4,6-dehydratase|nr:polysaccharide biosynthesis protein [Lentisphaeria bacterium]
MLNVMDYERFAGKHILITGGTGSLGRMLVRTLFEKTTASRTAVFSRDKFKQSEMAADFSDGGHARRPFFLGNMVARAIATITDEQR